MQAQSDSLHAQLAEEEARRQRADELVKALKGYADKAKVNESIFLDKLLTILNN